MADLDIPDEPARPETLTVDFYEHPDGLVLHKKRAGGPSFFLLLWLIGWTVGCVALVGKAISEPNLGTFAFALPFWASWLFVAGLLVWMFFGKEAFFLGRNEAVFARSAIVRLNSRVVPRSEILGFRECQSLHTENKRRLWGIEMVTQGKPLRFAFRLPDRERVWLVHQLNAFAGTQPPAGAAASLPATSTAEMRLRRREPPPAEALAATETLQMERTRSDPPADSRWEMVDDFETIEFARKGRWNIVVVAWLLFLNAFWNGVVSVFVLVLFGLMPNDNPPQGAQWWGMFVFLIPFEVIGLVLFAAMIFCLLEPFSRRTWRFEPDRIVFSSQWPLFQRRREWEIDGLQRLELRRRRRGDEPRRKVADAAADPEYNEPYLLAFIADGNVDRCEISGLTQGEARWIAHHLLDRREKWFQL